MSWLLDFAKSTIGAKVVMGVTGLLLVGFVIMHAWQHADLRWAGRTECVRQNVT